MQDASNTASEQIAMNEREAQVIEENQGLVQAAAQKILRGLSLRIERDDLVAYGNMGLLNAWRRYDPSHGAAFTTFAYYRVRGAMLDGCRKEGWLPRSRKARPRTQEVLNDHLEAQHEANLSAPAPRTLNESVSRVSDMVGSALTLILVEHSELDNVEIPHEERQDRVLERKDDNAMLDAAIRQLEPEERILIKRHHYYGDSITDIAHDLGKSKSWCSRMHTRAIERLRDILAPPEPAHDGSS